MSLLLEEKKKKKKNIVSELLIRGCLVRLLQIVLNFGKIKIWHDEI
jgi:hypothetical protein